MMILTTLLHVGIHRLKVENIGADFQQFIVLFLDDTQHISHNKSKYTHSMKAKYLCEDSSENVRYFHMSDSSPGRFQKQSFTLKQTCLYFHRVCSNMVINDTAEFNKIRKNWPNGFSKCCFHEQRHRGVFHYNVYFFFDFWLSSNKTHIEIA